jgi:hypothetical protein
LDRQGLLNANKKGCWWLSLRGAEGDVVIHKPFLQAVMDRDASLAMTVSTDFTLALDRSVG